MQGITEQAMTKLTGKDDYGTPRTVFNYIETNYVKKPFEIDACASDYNKKLDNYYSKENSLFDNQLDKTWFMNPIYGKKGWRTDKKTGEKTFNEYGTDDFVRFAHQQHFHYDSTGAILLFSNVSSSKYYQDCVGETPEDKIKNECAVFDFPHRINFLDENKKPVGTPSLSSIVVVYDKRFGR